MAEGLPDHLRKLSWGLVLLVAFMGLLTWAGLQNAFIPPPPSEPVYLVDMPAPLLAVNAFFILLPVAALWLLGLGLVRLRIGMPELGSRLTWHVGGVRLGPLRVVGLIIFGAIVAIAGALLLDVSAVLSGSTTPAASLFLGAAFSALLILLGWFLMVVSGQALMPVARGGERTLILVATILISVGGWFLAAVQFVAAAAGITMLAADPSAQVPPNYPWADGFSALAGGVGLAVFALVAIRAARRAETAPTSAAAASS